MQWLSGASDGSLAVWSQMKKRPVSITKQAHAAPPSQAKGGPAAMDSDAASWVQSVAACQGSDLVVSLCSPHDFECCVGILTRVQESQHVTCHKGSLLYHACRSANPIRATSLSTVSTEGVVLYGLSILSKDR